MRCAEEPLTHEKTFVRYYLSWASLVVALLQIVKVFAFKGTPWTQAFAATYVASFVVQEIINQLGKQDTITTGQPPGVQAAGTSTYDLEVWLPSMAQTLLWAWSWGWIMRQDAQYGELSAEDCTLDGDNFRYQCDITRLTTQVPRPLGYTDWIAWPLQLVLIIIPFGTLSLLTAPVDFAMYLVPIALLFVLVSFLFRPDSRHVVWLSKLLHLEVIYFWWFLQIFLGLGLIFLELLYLPFLPLFSYSIDHTDGLFDLVWLNDPLWYRISDGYFVLFLVAAASFPIYRIVVDGRLSFVAPALHRREASKEECAVLLLVIMNTVTTLTYHARCYNGSGTFNPRWTENIG